VRPLAELDVLVVDCQTTGSSPAFGHVLELGWGVTRAGQSDEGSCEAHWIELPPGAFVPAQVQKMTGYDASERDVALAPVEAWRRMRASIAGAPSVPSVIHYARFELAFLRDWSERYEPGAPFPLDAVCLHALACRLFPELPRQSLRALAGYLGHGLELTRRSLHHVEATAFVWQKLCEQLSARGIVTWEDLGVFLAEPGPKRTRAKKPRYPIASERYLGLPDEPGVYRFLRKNGDVLYVGKAASLRKRVASHFRGSASKLVAPEMLTQVSDIAVTPTPTALEAALLEHELIEKLAPTYNVQLVTTDPRVWYATRPFSDATDAPDAEHAIGPLASAYSLRPLGALAELVAGAPADKPLRAAAVGVSDLWIPDAEVFAAGMAELVARYPEALTPSAEPARRRVLGWARELLFAGVLGKSGEAEPEEKPEGWDPARVARHVERAVARAYQAYRRARWLELVFESDIVYREPAAERARVLRVRGGALVEATDACAGGAAPPGVTNGADTAPSASVTLPHAPSLCHHPPFDRRTYDRLRILTTELKRIARDGGSVSVHFGRRRTLPPHRSAGVLKLV
jgi:DNA polymerase III epsilon subunit-like protein